MRWSTRIGTFAGIDVKVHATFLLLLGWVALSHWVADRSLAAVVGGIVFILLLFACVVLHEFGHALVARRFGIKTRDIILLPIGGVARLEQMPDDPRQELWVAVAGPAVNGVIAAGLFVWLGLTGGGSGWEELGVTGGPLLQRLMVVNLFLIVFNMIPAFPMDGGRVLRALLALRLEYTRATQIAASIGQGLAFVFGFVGLFTNPFLVFIALFVWIGAGQEASLVQMRTALGGIPVQQVMITDFRTLEPNQTLDRAIELTLAGSQTDFPVVEGERVIGILTQPDLLKALAEKGKGARVEEIMQRDFEVAGLFEMIEKVFFRLQACDCHTIAVIGEGGRLEGLVTMGNVGEFLRIQAALAR